MPRGADDLARQLGNSAGGSTSMETKLGTVPRQGVGRRRSRWPPRSRNSRAWSSNSPIPSPPTTRRWTHRRRRCRRSIPWRRRPSPSVARARCGIPVGDVPTAAPCRRSLPALSGSAIIALPARRDRGQPHRSLPAADRDAAAAQGALSTRRCRGCEADDGELVAAADFLAHAEARPALMPKIDNLWCSAACRWCAGCCPRTARSACSAIISGATLTDAEVFPQLLDFLDANRALALGAGVRVHAERRSRAWGRSSTKASPRSPSSASASRWTTSPTCASSRANLPSAASASSRCRRCCCSTAAAPPRRDIHPADFSDLLGRFGIDLIAERIESETTVVDLLDYDVRFGQGFLFSPPRPVRAEALQEAAGNRPRKPHPQRRPSPSPSR